MATITVFGTEIVLDPENKVHEMIYSEHLTLEYIEKELSGAAASLARSMERVVKSIEDGMSTNSLGEVQSQGPKIDILCVRRAASADTLVKLLHLAGLR